MQHSLLPGPMSPGPVTRGFVAAAGSVANPGDRGRSRFHAEVLPPLERRVPGETDVRIFTTEVLPAGRHRVDRYRRGVRVVLDRSTGCPTLVRLAAIT
jgi:hypothetical protein